MPDGYAHRVTAAAVRSRGLITTRGHGPTWHAEITPNGQQYLANPPQPARKRPRQQTVAPQSVAKEAERKPVAPAPKPADIPVPESLRGAHPLVRATREAAVGKRPGSDGRITIGPRTGVAHLALSRPLLSRALRILQAITSEAKRRGWTVEPYDGARYGARPGIAIIANGHRYPIEIHETTETLDFTPEEIHAWRNEWSWNREERAHQMPPAQRKRTQATGKLRLSLPNGYGGGRANWTEGPRGPLEVKLASAFRTLEERIEHDDRAAEEAARRAAERQREEQEYRARQERQRIAQARAQRAVQEHDAWQRAQNLSAYATALRAGLDRLDPEERERVGVWCDWIDAYVRRSDPTVTTTLIVGLDDEGDARFY